MTPQEKANELMAAAELIVLAEVGSKLTETERKGIAKRTVLKCCDDVITELARNRNSYFQKYTIPFWELIKQELNK